ncbi:hypothetical protein M1L60_12670 [Actinoplanes sp. TRM 88003]|uniref:Alpha/beta hydrolase n=1 Tax=Paractinoplanes aksuensis TaxID=2939490 RepID=A0ABT1DKT4_9ACTN|nr:hypothetical protein [Actinoplanes aksuensis]MCO8271449.1 hypothetical protein [Actinoplanes aksuensis]
MRIGRILAATVIVLAAVAGFLTYARTQSQRAVSLAPSGPHPVGRLTDLWVDRSRTDQFAPVGGTPRMLSTWVWYPAAAGAREPESAYAPGPWAGLHRFGWAATELDRVRTGTRDEAPWAHGRFPIVVLLPDLGLSAPQYAAVASGLAARGNLVVGVTPTYSSRLSVINDHPIAASAAGSAPDRQDQLVSVWAADARFAAARASQQFGPRADNNRISYVGHGLGGTAAIAACRVARRCTAAVSLAGPPPTDGSSRPLLLLDTAPAPGSRSFEVRGAGRLSFTDLAAFHVSAPLRWTLPLGSIDGRRALAITIDYTASFLHAATTGETWKAPPYPEVSEATVLSR